MLKNGRKWTGYRSIPSYDYGYPYILGLLAQQRGSNRQANFTVVSNEVMRQLKSQLQGTNVETLYMCKGD